MTELLGGVMVTVLQFNSGHEIQAPREDGAMVEGVELGRCCFQTTTLSGVAGIHGDDPIGPNPLERVAEVRYVSSQPPSCF